MLHFRCPLFLSITPRLEKSMSLGGEGRSTELATVGSGGDSLNHIPTASFNDGSANATKAASVHRSGIRSSVDTPRSLDDRCHTDVDLNEPPTTSSDSFTDVSGRMVFRRV